METAVKDFRLDYFQKVDFKYWEQKLGNLLGKIKITKGKEKQLRYMIDLYTTYLQLLEIFFINVLIFSQRDLGFLSFLFISNSDLREKVKTEFDDEFIKWFFDNFVFGINEKETINNFQHKYKLYEQFLKESIKDYFNDYDFLNAYKHGFRVQIDNLVMADTNSLNPDVELTYFSKDKVAVYENTIQFNHKVTLRKCYLILSMLKNTIQIFIAQETKPNKKIKQEHLFALDESALITKEYLRMKKIVFGISNEKAQKDKNSNKIS